MNVLKKAIHTEKGIFDAVPLITGLPQPHGPVILSQDDRKSLQTSGEDAPRSRSTSTSGKLLENVKKAKENQSPKQKGATISNPFESPTKDKLFPHAEDQYLERFVCFYQIWNLIDCLWQSIKFQI